MATICLPPSPAEPSTDSCDAPHRSVPVLHTLALLLWLSVGSCADVAFYEKGRLHDPLMSFDDDPTEMHFQQKCVYSMEGAAGGIGVSAGGGCGCY